MKHIRLIAGVCALFSVVSLFAQTPDSARIEVSIPGIPAGKAKLVGTYGDQNYIADSADVDANGHFTLRRAHPLPAGYYYFLLPGMKNFAFMMDRNEQFFSIEAQANDIPGTLKAKNCLNAELFYQSARFQSKYDSELAQIGKTLKEKPAGSPEYKQAYSRQNQIIEERKTFHADLYKKYPDAFFTKFKIAGQNPDVISFKKPNGDTDTLRQLLTYRSRFWDGVDFSDERLLYTPVVVNKLRRYIKELTPQNPDSLIKVSDELISRVLPHRPYFQFFTNWIALQYENTKTTVMDGEAVYVFVIKKYITPELAFWDKKEDIERLRKHVGEMEASLIGRKGLDVRAMDISGQYKSIYELKSPLVVVFMYSPDCEHCQKDAPVIRQIAEKWKPRGVEFFGIAVNTTDAEWKEFHQKHQFPFPNVFDPTNRAIYAKYFVDITPELYVLNKDRMIVAKNLKPEQLEIIFDRELKKIK